MQIDGNLIAFAALIGILKLYSWYQMQCWSNRNYREDCNSDIEKLEKTNSPGENRKGQ